MGRKKKGQTSATPSEFQERYEALKKLDPDIAFQYAVAVNSKNRDAINNTGTTEFQGGFGKITKDEVDLIIAAATDGNQITDKEEEALLIILGTKKNWGDGVKEYMIEQIERNLKLFSSTSSIDQQKAGQLLMQTSRIDFTSQGDKQKGTGLHYTFADFQAIVHLIARQKITAWEVSGQDFYQMIPGAGTGGYYDITPNEIYLVSGQSQREQQGLFAQFTTEAIQDFRNGSWEMRYCQADSLIVRAFVALSLKSPYPTTGIDPLAVATRAGGAADMLMKPVASRDAKWKLAFKKAYDDVVAAYVADVGDARAQKPFFLESSAVQSEEKKVFMEEMNKALKGTSTRSKP